jgi:hypothetical protein
LDFVNPVKELYFVIQRRGTRGDGVSAGNFVTPFDYDNTSAVQDGKYILYENLDYLTLSLDGQDVITKDTGNVIFLKAIQAAIHHQIVNLSLTSCPDFSRQFRVYAESYNVLRVHEGIAQTLFDTKH